jgi:hypothetical protein
MPGDRRRQDQPSVVKWSTGYWHGETRSLAYGQRFGWHMVNFLAGTGVDRMSRWSTFQLSNGQIWG